MRTFGELRTCMLSMLCIVLFTFHGMNAAVTNSSLDEAQLLARAGTPVRVEVVAEVTTLSADEVTMFTESYKSAVNIVTMAFGLAAFIDFRVVQDFDFFREF